MIGEKSKEKAIELLEELIKTHWVEIKSAYAKAEKGLNVGLSMGFEEVGGKVHIVVGINFVADRVKNQVDALIDETQEPLFKAAEKFVKGIEKGKKGTSVSFESGDQSVTIQGKA